MYKITYLLTYLLSSRKLKNAFNDVKHVVV